MATKAPGHTSTPELLVHLTAARTLAETLEDVGDRAEAAHTLGDDALIRELCIFEDARQRVTEALEEYADSMAEEIERRTKGGDDA